ncbi:MAG: hypothetical protein PHV34_22390 [Verrucomicrobiae bacterium]|nr:hypothetical protein [Verrucomicrobiae bacterium]
MDDIKDYFYRLGNNIRLEKSPFFPINGIQFDKFWIKVETSSLLEKFLQGRRTIGPGIAMVADHAGHRFPANIANFIEFIEELFQDFGDIFLRSERNQRNQR